MNKFHGIGLVILLAVTFTMVESAYGSVTFTNDVGTVTVTAFSNITDTNSRFMDSFETDTKEYLLWVDDTCDDLIFFGTTTDGLTTSTPITINYIGGGCGVADQVVLNSGELFVSGSDVYISWIEDTNSLTTQDMFLKHSSDGGLTFGVERTVILDGDFTSTNVDMVANSLNDVLIFYRNSTSGNLENFVSHDNGATWAIKTVTGSGNVDEQSLKMVGNDVFVGGAGATFQKSTDAGDTWLGSALSLIGTGSAGIPFLFQNGTDVNLIYYDSVEVDYEQARSINGGTSFITTDLDLPLSVNQGCNAGTTPIERFIVISDGDSVTFACTLSINFDIKLIHSQDGSNTWDAIQTLDTESISQSGSFVGYAKDEITILVWRQSLLSSGERIAYSIDSLSASPSDSTWSLFPELFANAKVAHSGGTFPILSYPAMTVINDRIITVYDDSDFTDEQYAYSFATPYCVTDQDFNCPLDLTNKTTTVTSANRFGATATSNGYFTIYEESVGASNNHLFFASTTDAVTGTTPIDISGAVLSPASGITQDELYIFENSGTIDAFWIEPATPTSQLFHARSTNGGTSFGAKTSVVINATLMEPVVSGNNLDIAFIQKAEVSDNIPKFIQSINGGTSWGSVIDIEGTGDCDVAVQKIRLTKSASGNFYSAWMADNATSFTQAICFNRSTDGGTTWSTNEIILDDSTAQQEEDMEFHIFSSGTDVTVIWENSDDSEILQARSNDSGASFGAKEVALTTSGAPCVDGSITASAVQTGSTIIIACSGTSNGIHTRQSSDMGANYNAFTEISGTTNTRWNNISGFASGSFIFFVATNSTTNADNQNIFVFSTDTGATFDATKTMFMKTTTFRNLSGGNAVGTSTDVFVSFFQKTNYDATNNQYVSTASLGVPPPVNQPPVITILGDNPLQHLINTTYNDGGATCSDPEDGDLTSSIVTINLVNSSILGGFTVTYTCTDSGSLFDQEVRIVTVVEQVTTTTTAGGGAGSPVGTTPEEDVDGFTPEQQLAFDQAILDAIASIEPTPSSPLTSIIQTFFEFIVEDKTHEDIVLQSFLQDQRLGITWSTGQDIIIVNAIPASSPFMFTFEQFPVIKSGSGAFVSSNSILYNLEIPRNQCGITVTGNCVERIRYEVPITVNAVINSTQVSATGSITVDLTEDEIDAILLILLATLAIPVVGAIIHKARGGKLAVPTSRIISG